MALPPLHAKGPWTAKTPYVIPGNVSYTCSDTASFRDLESRNIDVKQKFYLDKGLTEEEYNLDSLNAAAIVKITADNYPTLEIPSTYITSFPTSADAGYARLIIGLDVGIFPTHFDLDYLMLDLKEAVKVNTGLDAEPSLNYAGYSGVVTAAQAAAFENNRKAAIAQRTTYFSRLKQQEQEIERLKTIIEKYENLLTNG